MRDSAFVYNGIILTGGRSSRMGSPKALLRLPDEKTTFLEAVVQKMQGLKPPPDKIIVVTGSHHKEITSRIPPRGFEYILNNDPDRGMLSSILEALSAFKNDPKGFMLALVDHPAVRDDTYQHILNSAQKKPGIVVPCFGNRRGHPVFFPGEVFPQLMSCPLDKGARYVVNNNPDILTLLDVEDGGILKDIDTPEKYKDLMKEFHSIQ